MWGANTWVKLGTEGLTGYRGPGLGPGGPFPRPTVPSVTEKIIVALIPRMPSRGAASKRSRSILCPSQLKILLTFPKYYFALGALSGFLAVPSLQAPKVDCALADPGHGLPNPHTSLLGLRSPCHWAYLGLWFSIDFAMS